jgi:hypothetical protein
MGLAGGIMHRPLFIALFCCLAAGMLSGQSITVTAPAGGESWCLGNTAAINWTSSGVAGPIAVKLRLADAPDADAVLSIVDSMGNTGSCRWAIPATLAPGRYLVRVRTVSSDPLVYDDSAAFAIVACAPPPAAAISVTAPAAGVSWCLGTTAAITWTSSGVAGPVAIKLRLADAPAADPVLSIVDSMDNTGTCRWAIPAVLAPGRYQVRVRTVASDPLVYGDSPAFAIAACPVPPAHAAAITVTGPAAGSRLPVGGTVQIRWASTDRSWEEVHLRLVEEFSSHVIEDIINRTNDDGAYDWELPAAVGSGRYRVSVKALGSPPLGYSGVFAVYGKERTAPDHTEFRVLKPAAGDVLYVGEETTIVWESPAPDAITMPCGSEVGMLLNRIGKAGQYRVAARYANHKGRNGLTWSPAPGYFREKTGTYQLVCESSNGCRAESGIFRIENRFQPGAEGSMAQAANPADLIGCDYGIGSMTLADGRSLDSGVAIGSDNLLVELATPVHWNGRGPGPGTLALEVYSPLSGRRLDKFSVPAAFASAQADGSGIITVRSSISLSGRGRLLEVLRGRFLPLEVRLLPSQPECDGLAANNRRQFSLRVSNPPIVTDLKLEIEPDSVSVHYRGRGSRGRSKYDIWFWVRARNLTANEAGGSGETLFRVPCSCKALERMEGRFDTLHEFTFVFDEVRYGSDWRMSLNVPIEVYRDSGNPISCVLILDPEGETSDPDRENNRTGMVIRLPD